MSRLKPRFTLRATDAEHAVAGRVAAETGHSRNSVMRAALSYSADADDFKAFLGGYVAGTEEADR